MKRTIKIRILLDIILLVILVTIVVFINMLKMQIDEYETASENYETIKEIVVKNEQDGNAMERSVDFSYLDETNHVIGSWIYIPGTAIDYPVVQGIDNEIYLNYDAYGNESKYGAIFLSCDNRSDYSDYKTVIYGHSMKDGSMFHSLHNYTDEHYAASNSIAYIYMPDGTIEQYQLLCTAKVNAYDENVYLNKPDDKSAGQYILNKSDYIYSECNGNNLIVLSTCIRGDSRRIVVFQKIS